MNIKRVNLIYNRVLFLISIQSISEQTLRIAQESFLAFMREYHKIFGVTAMTSKVHALQHVLDDCETQGSHLDYNSVYDCESEQQQWGRGKIIRNGNQILQQIRFDQRSYY
jgi:hypothetical protein